MERSQPVEDYLKAAYVLASTGDLSGGRLAERLGVTPSAVSAMLKRLEGDGLLTRNGRHLGLSPEGEGLAVRMLRRHRLLETFLHRALGMPWDEVHEEAERLEHALSERLEQLIDASLGHPTHDPHGDPIPPAGGVHREEWTESLEEVAEGSRVVVDRVLDDPEVLRHLAGLGIGPGTELVVEEQAPFGGPVWARVGRRRHALGREVARAVHVSVVAPEPA